MAVYYTMPGDPSMLGLLQYVNVITGGVFGPALVVGFFAIMFMSMKRFETEKAFSSSMFLATILCFLLFLIGLTTYAHLFLATILSLASVFLLKSTEGGI